MKPKLTKLQRERNKRELLIRLEDAFYRLRTGEITCDKYTEETDRLFDIYKGKT